MLQAIGADSVAHKCHLTIRRRRVTCKAPSQVIPSKIWILLGWLVASAAVQHKMKQGTDSIHSNESLTSNKKRNNRTNSKPVRLTNNNLNVPVFEINRFLFSYHEKKKKKQTATNKRLFRFGGFYHIRDTRKRFGKNKNTLADSREDTLDTVHP